MRRKREVCQQLMFELLIGECTAIPSESELRVKRLYDASMKSRLTLRKNIAQEGRTQKAAHSSQLLEKVRWPRATALRSFVTVVCSPRGLSVICRKL